MLIRGLKDVLNRIKINVDSKIIHLKPVSDLHLQISSGAASKKTEEQIWEQQRIVTQLKVSKMILNSLNQNSNDSFRLA